LTKDEGAYVAQNGYLGIALKNNSNIAISGIKIQIAKLVDRNTLGPASTLRGSYSLSPGQQKSIKTDIGPFDDVNKANLYRSRVTAAKPATKRSN